MVRVLLSRATLQIDVAPTERAARGGTRGDAPGAALKERERRGFRFRPPEVVASPELRFVLWRSLGQGRLVGGTDGTRAAELASRLRAAARIGALAPFGSLERELGRRGACQLLFAAETARRRAEALARVTENAAALAAAAGVPVVLLKFAALQRSRAVTEGVRAASDVDLLVAEIDLPRLAAQLLGAGFRQVRVDVDVAAHQLAPFRAPSGVLLELHRLVPGVRVRSGGSFARLEDLRAASLLRPAAELAGESSVPSPEVLVAHALVHGVAQHGLAPGSYPLLWMLFDLVDLGVLRDPSLVERAGVLIAGEVSKEERRAVIDLAARLCEGDPSLFDEGATSPARLLLRHMLAGSLDETYDRSLRLRYHLDPLSDRPRLLAVAGSVKEAMFPRRMRCSGSALDLALAAPARVFELLARWSGQALRRAQPPFRV